MTLKRNSTTALFAAALLCAGPALAQDDDIPPPPDEPGTTTTTPEPAETPPPPSDEETPPPPDDDAERPKTTTPKPQPKPAEKPAQPKASSSDETVYVVQRKPVVAKYAFEVAPQFLQSVNDRFNMHTGGAISGLFHFRENFAVQLTVGGLWGRDSDLTKEIRDKESLKPELVQLAEHTWLATADLQWSPIYGKVSIMDLVLGQFSTYVSVGGGLMGTRLRRQPPVSLWRDGDVFQPRDPGNFWDWLGHAYEPVSDDPITLGIRGSESAAGRRSGGLPQLLALGTPTLVTTIGLGVRFYLTEWLGFRFEVRDYVQPQRVNHRQVNPQELISTFNVRNTYMVQVGVSFLTPRLPLGGGRQ